MTTLTQAKTTSFGYDFEKEREFLRSRVESTNNFHNHSSSFSSPINNKCNWAQQQACNDDFFQLNFDNDDSNEDDNNQESEEPFEILSCNISKNFSEQDEYKDLYGFPIGVSVNIDERKTLPLSNNIMNTVPLVYVPSAPLYLNNTHMVLEEGEHKKIILQMQSFINTQSGVTYDFTNINCTWHLTYMSNDNQKQSFEIKLFKGTLENTHIIDLRHFEGQRIFFSEFYNKFRSEFSSKKNRYSQF
jgi:hypothetical protein